MPFEKLFTLGLCVVRSHSRTDRIERASAKRHWHEHINFFSEAAIDAMTARAGLAVLERVSHPVSAGGATCQVFSVIARLHR